MCFAQMCNFIIVEFCDENTIGAVPWVNNCNIKPTHADKLLHLLQQAGHKLMLTATTLF